MTFKNVFYTTCLFFNFIGASLIYADCTSVLVTKGASVDGSTMISYSCDGEFHPRLNIIPAADHKAGDMHKIRKWDGTPDGIPQIAHTYKVVGLINEHQLAIGETTFGGRPELANREGLLSYYPLMLLGLQRAKTAREAITVMTTLVEEHGYRSTGESFSIADKEEVWMVEMVGPGKGGKGAVWVAVKIPDGMVAAHANMSRIRDFPLDDPDNVMYSKNVISFAVKKGYFDPDTGKRFSFTEAYNPPTEEQVRYSSRRVWSIFRRTSPSLRLSSDYSSYKKDTKPYPLYVKPDSKLSVRNIMALHRDHYEGTEFDMTKNVTAGPFGAPDRWRPIKWKYEDRKYAWERPISTQQAAFVFISQSRSNVPDKIGGVNWYGLDNPYTNFFVPLYSSITELPKSYTMGTLKQYSDDSAWWVFNFVANYANLRWSYMIEDIAKRQKEIEDLAFDLQPAIEKTASILLKENPDLVDKYLTNYCVTNAEMNVGKWRDLAHFLITKYNDGYIQDENGRAKEIGYPKQWLKREVKENASKLKLQQERNGEGEL